jgi:hypothetical protein
MDHTIVQVTTNIKREGEKKKLETNKQRKLITDSMQILMSVQKMLVFVVLDIAARILMGHIVVQV